MLDIFAVRGCYFKIGSSNSSGYALSPSIGFDPIIYGPVVHNGRDIVSGVPCFNQKRMLYKFGKDFGNITISGKLILGPVNSSAQGEGALRSWYESNRGNNAAISSVFGNAVSFVVNGISIGGIDNEYNILDFTINGVLLD